MKNFDLIELINDKLRIHTDRECVEVNLRENTKTLEVKNFLLQNFNISFKNDCEVLKQKSMGSIKTWLIGNYKINIMSVKPEFVTELRVLSSFIFELRKSKTEGVFSVLVIGDEGRQYFIKGEKEFVINHIFYISNQTFSSDIFTLFIKQKGVIFRNNNSIERKILIDIPLKYQRQNELLLFINDSKIEKCSSQVGKLFEHKYLPFEGQKIISRKQKKVIIEINPFGPVSILKKIHEEKICKKDKIFVYRSNSSMIDIKRNSKIKNTNSGGVDKDESLAKIKAFVESVERVSSGSFDLNEMSLLPIKREKLVIDILGYDCYKKGRSHPHVSLGEKYRHVKVYRLKFNHFKHNFHLDGEYFLPYDLVYYPVVRNSVDRFAYANSSGISAHSSYYKAIENSVLELYERDSVMKVWLQKKILDKFIIETLPKKIKERVENLEKRFGYRINILDASLGKNAYCIIATAFNKQNKSPYFQLGSSCELDLSSAISKAVSELESFFYSSASSLGEKSFLKRSDVKDVTGHYFYYHQRKHHKKVDFLKGNKNKNYTKSKKFSIKEIVNHENNQWYVYDLSNDYSISKNIYIVKVFNPNLLPIWFGAKALPKKHNSILGKVKRFDFLHPMG